VTERDLFRDVEPANDRDSTGKLLYFENGGPDDVTLQDDSMLPGSKLKRRSPTILVKPDEWIQLVCDGLNWVQVGT
jgi:hypothetical protein